MIPNLENHHFYCNVGRNVRQNPTNYQSKWASRQYRHCHHNLYSCTGKKYFRLPDKFALPNWKRGEYILVCAHISLCIQDVS